MSVIEANRRFFILTAARSGSTLLSAILGDVGANFGMTIPASWDPASGDLEHPDLSRAYDFFSKAELISKYRPHFGVSRLRWVLYRSYGKKTLRAVLNSAHFVKRYNAHKLVRPAFKIGYFPTVILSYRRFEDQAISFGLMHPHADWDLLCKNYWEVYNNGLWLLNTFGGCVVAYENMVDPSDCGWAEPLADVTGLAVTKLIDARDRRLTHAPPRCETNKINPQAYRIYEARQALTDKAIPPSSQALRAWHRSAARWEIQPAGSKPVASCSDACCSRSRACSSACD
jgi:hypothetical protein